jgi:hypothetical protein
VTSVLILTAALFAGQAVAQEYPVSGEIYLSFESNRHVPTRNVAPGEQFELWMLVDIPNDPADPGIGVVGVEGAIELPPQTELIEAVVLPPAINLGASYREPGLETFVVGLGECVDAGPLIPVGYVTLRLTEAGEDIEIQVTAPAVQASPVSSFAGIGPGWAAQDCREPGATDLVLFAETTGPRRSVIINSSAVPVTPGGLTSIKARYR